MLSRSSKRRLIQISFELLGSPPELDDQGEDQWEGSTGVINTIRDYLGLRSHRARLQIKDVITHVMRCVDEGEEIIDAGIKLGAHNSGRKSKLNDRENRLVTNML